MHILNNDEIDDTEDIKIGSGNKKNNKDANKKTKQNKKKSEKVIYLVKSENNNLQIKDKYRGSIQLYDTDNYTNRMNISTDILSNNINNISTKKTKNIKGVFDFDNIYKFLSIIQYKLRVENHYSKTYFYMCKYKNIKFLTKLGYYVKNDPELYKRTENMHEIDSEIAILEYLNKLNIYTPGITELLYYKKMKHSKLIKGNLCKHNANKKLGAANIDTEKEIIFNTCTYQNMIRLGLAYDKVAFVILERCDISFKYIIMEPPNLMKDFVISFLFQIFYTLHIIHKYYPTFIHFDLHTNNIMLRFNPNYSHDENYKCIKYTFDDNKCKHTAYIPYFGAIVKLIDFGFSSLPEKNIYNSVLDDKYISLNRSNKDIYHLLHHIYVINPAYDFILKEIDPQKHYITYSIDKINKLKVDYAKILKNDIFKKYYKEPAKYILSDEYKDE